MSVTKALNLGKSISDRKCNTLFIIVSFTDAKSQRKFIDFFNNKFSADGLVFRVFERQGGDFYSIHGKDIELALKTSFKSSIIVKTMAPDELASLKYASFNKNIFEKIIKELLIVIGYKVEVYTSSKSGEWALEFKGSPGNLAQFEDLLFSVDNEVLTNLLLAVQLVSTQQQKVSWMASCAGCWN